MAITIASIGKVLKNQRPLIRDMYNRISIQKSLGDLTSERKPAEDVCTDPQDLKMFDFFRVCCLIWVLCFGVCQFTMAGSAYNPWTL